MWQLPISQVWEFGDSHIFILATVSATHKIATAFTT